MYKEIKAALKKLQKEMKKYANRNRQETVEYKEGNRVLSMKDLMQLIRNKKMKKLTEKFVGPYKENYIRKCSRVGVAGINENLPGSKYEQDSNVLGASRGTEKDLISFSRDRQRKRI